MPEFLSSVPVDYMDGQPINARLNPTEVSRSIPWEKTGRMTAGMSLPEGSKSRDLWRRKDYVWPAPATPEEVAEYRRQAGRN